MKYIAKESENLRNVDFFGKFCYNICINHKLERVEDIVIWRYLRRKGKSMIIIAIAVINLLIFFFIFIKIKKEEKIKEEERRGEQHRELLLKVVDKYQSNGFFEEDDRNRFRKYVEAGFFDGKTETDLLEAMFEDEYTSWSTR